MENLFRVHAQCPYRRKDGRFGKKQVGEESHDMDLPPHTYIWFSWYSLAALLLHRAWMAIIHQDANLIRLLSNAKQPIPAAPNRTHLLYSR
jgi:hypothetical protein